MPRSKAKLHLFVGRQMFSADNLLNNFEIEKEKEGRRGGKEKGRGRGVGGARNILLSIFALFFFSPPLVTRVIKCPECGDLLHLSSAGCSNI